MHSRYCRNNRLTGTFPTEFAHLKALRKYATVAVHVFRSLFTFSCLSLFTGTFNVYNNAFTGNIAFVCQLPDVMYYYGCEVECGCCYKTCGDCTKVNGMAPKNGCSPTTTTKGAGNGTRAI
jgi:hypothetical protein